MQELENKNINIFNSFINFISLNSNLTKGFIEYLITEYKMLVRNKNKESRTEYINSILNYLDILGKTKKNIRSLIKKKLEISKNN